MANNKKKLEGKRFREGRVHRKGPVALKSACSLGANVQIRLKRGSSFKKCSA